MEAKREDWTRDPFTLIEEDGYFYGRGTSDMKAQAATWVDADPLQEEAISRALHQDGADLRRGDHVRIQWRPVAGEERPS